LLSRIILACTQQGGWVLDPFAGSSTTGIAANLLGRRYLGIEQVREFVDLSKARRIEIENINVFDSYRTKIKDVNTSVDILGARVNDIEVFEDLPF
jgi:site-specific DNA-methyltransferase (adenine-specific)